MWDGDRVGEDLIVTTRKLVEGFLDCLAREPKVGKRISRSGNQALDHDGIISWQAV